MAANKETKIQMNVKNVMMSFS